jgi:hypothetical protein
MLFDVVERTSTREAQYGESRFAATNRLAGGYWDNVRAVLEEWFARLPNNDQADVRQRLRSSDDRAFQGAFFELYCHESLVRLGYTVTSHPNVPGTSRRPDYLATKGSEEFVLEVTVVGESDEKVAAQRRRAAVFDAINKVGSPNFFLNVVVHAEGVGSPPTSQLRSDLTRWMSSLDPNEVIAEFDELLGLRALPPHRWRHEGWDFEFRAIPKSEQWQGSDDSPTIGMFGNAMGSVIGDDLAIRRQVMDKASAYGNIGLPYIIAVSIDSMFATDTTVVNALYGSDQVGLATRSDGSIVTVSSRAPDGVFVGRNGPQYRRVSGVLVAIGLWPYTVSQAVPTLWHIPYRNRDFTVSSTPWRHAIIDTQTALPRFIDPLRSPAEFFDLSHEWPGPHPPFPDGHA